MRRLGQRGDTIVEVLIALAVLSIVLTGAYVSSRNSLNNTRDAQERGEALKLAEEQLEKLRNSLATLPAFTTLYPFCIDSSGVARPHGTSLSTFNTAYANVANDPLEISASAYDNRCVVNSRYHISLARANPDSSTVEYNNFVARVRWVEISGRTKDEAKIIYRIEP